MKRSRSEIRRKAVTLPDLRFEGQELTSYSGLIVFQRLFAVLGLRGRLRRCFRALDGGAVYGLRTVIEQLIVHFLLGYRELRQCRHYQHDPIVKRVLGLDVLPDVSTISRTLAKADNGAVEKFLDELRRLVLDRLRVLALPTLTVDFDGSVQSTGRCAEGTAVGFNRKKKGARSYYPLLCTIAQTGQVFSVLHRPGNVHDSNGAKAFILECLRAIRTACPCPGTRIEVRMDGAFFDEKIIAALHAEGIEFTVSVPFARLAELKGMVEARKRWRRASDDIGYFERSWKPKSWSRRYRFVFVRSRTKRQHKGPVQLNLFVPYEHGFDFKVIVTSKKSRAHKVIAFHEGRGAQEAVFAELKSDAAMDYVPTHTLCGNQVYLVASLMAHNLTRELQMISGQPARTLNDKRSPLWPFARLSTLCRDLIQRAGRLTRPQGRLTLTMNANHSAKKELLHYLEVLEAAA
jgi:hypothetical protein